MFNMDFDESHPANLTYINRSSLHDIISCTHIVFKKKATNKQAIYNIVDLYNTTIKSIIFMALFIYYRYL